jgi:hypothetical protein
MDEIKKIVMMHKQITEQALNEYAVLVNQLILSETKDQNEIEHALDGLLDFCYDDNILILYKKLCRYYYYINQEATVFYVNSYREMWDNESDNPEEQGI